MSTRNLFLAALAASVFAAGCAKPAPEAPAVDVAAEAQAIRDRSAEWQKLATAKDAAAIVSQMLTPDSMTLYDGEIHKGAAAIQADLEADYAAAPASTIVWVTKLVNVAASGDLAYEHGEMTVDEDGPGEGAPVTGEFITIWSKADGTWRAAADAGTLINPPVAAEAPAGG